MNNYYSDPLKMYPFILIKICPGHFCFQHNFFLAVGTGKVTYARVPCPCSYWNLMWDVSRNFSDYQWTTFTVYNWLSISSWFICSSSNLSSVSCKHDELLNDLQLYYSLSFLSYLSWFRCIQRYDWHMAVPQYSGMI